MGMTKQKYKCTNEKDWAFTRIENFKAFLSVGVGVSHWGLRPEFVGLETHDVKLSLAMLAKRGYLTKALITCRTGAPLDCVKEGCRGSIAGRFEGSRSSFKLSPLPPRDSCRLTPTAMLTVKHRPSEVP